MREALAGAGVRGRVGLPPMAAAMATTTAAQLPVFLTGALSVQMGSALQLGTRTLAVAVAVFFGSSALCSARLGRLADRLGGAAVMRIGTVPAIAAMAWIGAGVQNAGWLIAALALAGAANGAIQPAANRYLTRAVAAHRQGLAFGVKQAAIPAATLLSGLSVPLVAHTAGWRVAFGAGAALTALVALLVRGGRRPAPEQRRPEHDARPAAGTDPPQSARRALLLLAAGIGTGSAAANAMGAFLVVSAVRIGESDSAAGLVAAAASVASMLVRLAIGVRADRRSAGHLRVVALMCAVGSVGPFLFAAEDRGLLLVAAVIGYGLGWGWAGLFNFAIATAHPAAPGRATGLTQVGASAGACLGPLCFGLAAARFGFSPAWIGAAAALLAAALVILAGRRKLLAGLVLER